MNRKERMVILHKECCETMHQIMLRKTHDYSGTEEPFSNFQVVEKIGICSTEQGFLTRMMDKISRISNFVQQGELKVKDESVEDTLMDLSNYALLMLLYIKMEKEDEQRKTEKEEKAKG